MSPIFIQNDAERGEGEREMKIREWVKATVTTKENYRQTNTLQQ